MKPRVLSETLSWEAWVDAWKKATDEATLFGLLHSVMSIPAVGNPVYRDDIETDRCRFLLTIAGMDYTYPEAIRVKAFTVLVQAWRVKGMIGLSESAERALIWIFRTRDARFKNFRLLGRLPNHLSEWLDANLFSYLIRKWSQGELKFLPHRHQILRILATYDRRQLIEELWRWLYKYPAPSEGYNSTTYRHSEISRAERLALKLEILDAEAISVLHDLLKQNHESYQTALFEGDRLAHFLLGIEQVRAMVEKEMERQELLKKRAEIDVALGEV